MSLKAFHFVFIVAAILLSLVMGGWCLMNYHSPNGQKSDLYWSIGAGIAALALAVYERYFLKRFKKVSYL